MLSSSARAATFAVDTTDTSPATSRDLVPGDGVCATRDQRCSLPAALDEANALGGPDMIALPSETFALEGVFGTDAGAGDFALPKVTSDVTVTGAGAGRTGTILQHAAGSAGAVMFLVDAGALTLTDVLATDGTAAGGPRGGGAVASHGGGSVALRDCAVTGIMRTAVSAVGGVLTIDGCVFTGNRGSGGGAVYVLGATTTIHDSTFDGNVSADVGGAVFLDSAPPATPPATIDASVFKENTAAEGGALYVETANVIVHRSTFGNNRAHGLGGGAVFALAAKPVLVVDSTFDGNRAEGPAGGSVHGGAIFAQAAVVSMGSTFFANVAAGEGGAVYAGPSGAGSFAAANSTFSGNQAALGGALAAGVDGGAIALASATVTQNTAGTGGGIGRRARLRNAIVAGNTSATGVDCSGTLASEGHNLIGTTAGGCTVVPASGDQVGGAVPLDPRLGPLAPNGGITATHALLGDSPAGEAGDPAGCTDPEGASLAIDQRGTPRAQDGDSDGAARCDVGAYEAPAGTFPPPATTTTSSTTTSTTATTTTSTTTSTTTTTSSTVTTTTFPLFQLVLDPCLNLDPTDDTKPVKIVGQGVTSFTLEGQSVFWHDAGFCPSGLGAVPEATRVRRRPVYCGLARTIFQDDPGFGGRCNLYVVRSNLAVDATHVYWVDDSGLVRLPVGANPGDPTELVTDDIQPSFGGAPVGLAVWEDEIIALRHTGDAAGTSRFLRAPKSGGAATPFHFTTGAPAGALTSDGEYVYYLHGGTLRRLDPSASPVSDLQLATGVGAYHAEGPRTSCSIVKGVPTCTTSRFVYLAQGRNLRRYSNGTGTLSAILYTTPDTDGEILGIATTPTKAFVFEARTPSGGARSIYLVRMGRTGSSPEVIHAREGVLPVDEPVGLTAVTLSDGAYLVWQEAGTLYRLPSDVSEMLLTDLSVGNIEVTQAIQDLSNSVPLIKRKRTFVRVFGQAAGVNTPGVTARLYGAWSGGGGGPLVPINGVGQSLTVRAAPNRNDIDHAFLFQLPSSWTTRPDLLLTAVINPDHTPLEPNYANNAKVAGPFAFQSSGRLQVQFVAWGYEIGGTSYYPRLVEDIVQTYSWIRRVYPLASTPGFADDPTPGFRPNLWYVFDSQLGNRVNRTNPVCAQLYPPPDGDTSLCASYYTNNEMHAMRFEQCVHHLPSIFDFLDCYAKQVSTFYYGLIRIHPSFFPRGQACCAPAVSSGPAGSMCCGAAWDTDGAITDWYAGHEIGHTLGRPHPSKGNACGHSADDPSYPYAGALIGDGTTTLAGFDGGDSGFGFPRAVLPRTQWADLMSYCNWQWISDYTYELMKAASLGSEPSLGVPRETGIIAGAEYLSVSGFVAADGATAAIDRLRRIPGADMAPPLPPGAHHLQLADADGALLADHPFAPAAVETEEPGTAPGTFAFLVPFVPGTREVRVTDAGGTILGSRELSENAPVVTDVRLVPPPSGPVGGTVTLAWDATDADGDALAFDVLYSVDGGAGFQPLAVNLPDPTTAVDTGALAGGTAILRVVASDGANTGAGETPPFEVARKPPQAHIIAPGDGEQVQYGQLVTLTGEAFDPEDGTIPEDGLVWSLPQGVAGTGAELPLDGLPVGVHVVTLAATDSDAQTATAQVTIVVTDDAALPGPVLSAAPMNVGWSVAPGAGAVTTAVDVTNIGGGTLTWTASTDASWLELGATSGGDPGVIPLSADASGLPSGTLLAGELTITGMGEGGVALGAKKILVTLAVGDVYRANAVPATTSTTTTLGPGTTTTTTLPVCSPPDCNDGDACTDDGCVEGAGCSNPPKTGFAAATCLCGAPPPACAGQAVPKGVVRRFERACQLVVRAEQTTKQKVQARLLAKAARDFGSAARQAVRAGGGRKPKIGDACAEAYDALLGELRMRVKGLRPRR